MMWWTMFILWRNSSLPRGKGAGTLPFMWAHVTADVIWVKKELDPVGREGRTQKNVFNKPLQAVPVRKCWRPCTAPSTAIVPPYRNTVPEPPQNVSFKSLLEKRNDHGVGTRGIGSRVCYLKLALNGLFSLPVLNAEQTENTLGRVRGTKHWR